MIRPSSVLIFLLLSGCNNHREQPAFRFHEKPLAPLHGTVPIKDKVQALKITRGHLLLGQKLFNRNCALCHGLDGSGDSLPVRRGLTRPDPLYEKDLANIYDVITHGIGRMPSFRRKLTPEERQMVVAYVEALRLSRRFPAEKLDEFDKEKLK